MMAQLFTVKETAEKLGLHKVTVYNLITGGTIKAKRIGPREIRVTEAEIARYQKANAKKAKTVPAKTAKPKKATKTTAPMSRRVKAQATTLRNQLLDLADEVAGKYEPEFGNVADGLYDLANQVPSAS